jgi:predicted metal-dependent HD superfamily phosphohydrolase
VRVEVVNADSGSESSGPDPEGPLRLPAEQWQTLREAYASPPRAYHHFGHVRDVLAHYRHVAEGPGWQRPHEVWFAVLYHDAIYVPGRRDNESRSARLADAHLARWWPDAGIDRDRIGALIVATARHGSLRPDDFADDAAGEDMRRFLDCDMAILGAEPEVFAVYDRAIAEEYRAVPRWLYRRKRRAFFRTLLDAERIFLSDFFRGRCEAQARRNLEAAIAG